ncbi:hypothetical protein AB0G73_36950 [Streptomyces sp. NPDC020719]|uniref:hypothetical protein n=1 Tax=Streptomyces sp. NPDC020719 TaxID=3154896 RepID=UPI00341035F2
MTDEEHPDLLEYDWVVWELEVRDPHVLTPPGVGERTEQALTELAGGLGCVFDHCVDDDSYDGSDAGTYYAWLVRVPQAEHRRRGADGLPLVVAPLWEFLRTQLPAGLDAWTVTPHLDLSFRRAAGDLLKDAYADLLDPVEVALLGSRREGAERIEPLVKVWGADSDYVIGTYAMLLARDPDVPADESAPWLVLEVGVTADPSLLTSPAGTQAQRFGVSTPAPLLLLPRPARPVWTAAVTTHPFTNDHSPSPRGVGARHQWTAADPAQLAARVARDLHALWLHPH